MGALDHEVGRRVARALEVFLASLEQALGNLPPQQAAAVQASEEIVRFLAARLYSDIEAATAEGRKLSFNATQEIWQEAMARVARAEGVPDRLLGAVRVPPVSMLGAFESLNGTASWRTLLRNRVAAAATEAGAIVRQGIASGVGPDEIARRLRRYVRGSEGFGAFEGLDGKIDLRKVPLSIRGQAAQMRFNAERIAFTEVHSARHEAEVQHQIQDPFVLANLWQLAPDRGAARVPDGCDFIARGDYYGLGRGVYPVNATPSLVHPFDRCEIIPVSRPAKDAMDRDGNPLPKPDPRQRTDPMAVRLPGQDKLTTTALARERKAARDAIALGQRASRQGKAA